MIANLLTRQNDWLTTHAGMVAAFIAKTVSDSALMS
jgi:hypothetical protein